MNETISVIIPAYNSEKTLEACVNSVRKQTYPNLEIIIVDDCSEDSTLVICNKLANIDDRIKVIKHTTNQGVSESRNTGLNSATGKYIAFVDSDDTVELDMYRLMLESLTESNADICICQLKLVDHPGDNPRSIVDNSYEGTYDNSYDMIRILYNSTSSTYKDFMIQAVFNKLYRREILGQDRFIGTYSEDCHINNRIFAKMCKVCIVKFELYNYFYTYNVGSLSHKATIEQRLFFLDIFINRYQLYDDKKIKIETMKRYCSLYTLFLNEKDAFSMIGRGYYEHKYKEYINALRHTMCWKKISKKNKTKWLLAYINPTIFHYILLIRKKILY